MPSSTHKSNCSKVIVEKKKKKTRLKRAHMAEKKRCMCQLCGPTVHIKLCDNCRGKHSWWKAISQIILATIRECGGVKWRFHMQMCRWERSGTLQNSYDPHSPALVCFTWDRRAQRHRLTLLGRRKKKKSTGLSQASIT